MSRKRSAGTFPQPPWSYAPSEVAEWLASTAGPGSRRASRVRRPLRVKGFVGHCPTSAEEKLLRRLAEFGFERAAVPTRIPTLFRWTTTPADAENFVGKLGETGVDLRLRRGAILQLHVAFVPAVSYRRASKFLSRFGLRGLEGTWK